ncbi:plasmid pRiA4b ORF-3 family protein [Arthrobacter crystallopoietes BAB-32]|uniref:Plasmid pRiA4b ORF-3 family protein n=1 Tax=Arthrobacter crystallopoietes BAB-32 TaxID=1246476 RepID=N1V9W8_9MICC|nr:plasmid pRiA4b ORF-3 family protein [Arthrobacter crystallopoietes]EMY35083.1 plasmid pRiA4b ORF-3 family protein [Arthrobacter crystallopoietes BAB-32]
MPASEKAFDLRVVIQASEPEIWRALRIPTAAPLSVLHEAIQRAFGWENRHLYLIHPDGAGGVRRPIAGYEESADELGLESVEGKTIGDLLSAEGSTLDYEYDLGDSWIHTVTVTGHAVMPAGRISCLGGENRGPLEDAGGMWGYQEKCRILADPEHPQHREIYQWYTHVTGEFGRTFDPSAFDLNAVNEALERLRVLLADEPPTPQERAVVLRPVRWLLDRAREDGLELTKAGFLKPALVREIADTLNWYEPWMGQGNREAGMPDVANLREQLQAWKLLRKHKDRLLPTPAARKMYDDDAALWDFVAGRLVHQPDIGLQVALRSMVGWMLQGRVPPRSILGDAVAGELVRAGLRPAGGGPLTAEDGRSIYYHLLYQLRALAIFHDQTGLGSSKVPTAAGMKLLLDLRRRFGGIS